MPNPIQATTPMVVDAGYVRLAELGAHLKYLRDNYQPRTNVVFSIIDLRQKIEALALTKSLPEQATLKQYLQETYGLLSVYTDPMLRPLLPVLPAMGSRIRRFVLAVNGKALLANTKLIALGAELVVSEAAPVYNTNFLPNNDTIGAVTYNGEPGDVFSMDMPVDASTDLPQFVRLLIDGMQVGRVDFPPTAAGAGFSLLHDGELYYGVLQVTADNTMILSL